MHTTFIAHACSSLALAAGTAPARLAVYSFKKRFVPKCARCGKTNKDAAVTCVNCGSARTDEALMHTVAQEAKLGGHHLALTDCQISPDGARAVTASLDRSARVWRLDGLRRINAKMLHTDDPEEAEAASPRPKGAPRSVVLSGHKGGVTSAQFTPGVGRLVLTTSMDYSARVWDAATGKQLYQLGRALNKVRG